MSSGNIFIVYILRRDISVSNVNSLGDDVKKSFLNRLMYVHM